DDDQRRTRAMRRRPSSPVQGRALVFSLATNPTQRRAGAAGRRGGLMKKKRTAQGRARRFIWRDTDITIVPPTATPGDDKEASMPQQLYSVFKASARRWPKPPSLALN